MRERFSTGIYCDFCGTGKDEQPDMIAAPGPANCHICRGCVTLFANERKKSEGLKRDGE